MKKRISFLAVGAAICVLLLLIFVTDASRLTAIALPFVWIGNGLRALSLSGTAGNIAAIGLYVLACLLPMLLALKRKWRIEDWLLPVTSGAMAYILYLMINPGLRPAALSGDVGTLICACSVYSVLLAWSVIRLLRYCDNAGVSKIYGALRIFLAICAVECVWIGFGIGFGSFRADIAAMQEANTMPGLNLVPTYIFQFLTFGVTALEYGLDALVMFLGIGLLRELEKDPYSDSSYMAAERCAAWCRRAMIIIATAYAALNLAQVFFAGLLHYLDSQFRFPVISMAIVFAMLALSRLLYQGKQMKEDNDLFI